MKLVIFMAKSTTKDIKKAEKEKKYVNPTTKPAGKVIIFTLAILMCLSGLISLIYLIVKMAQGV